MASIRDPGVEEKKRNERLMGYKSDRYIEKRAQDRRPREKSEKVK